MESRDDRIKRIMHDHNITDLEAKRVADAEIRFEENKATRLSEYK